MNDAQNATTQVAHKPEGYSAREQELIRQLMQSRLQQKASLEHEDLDGYEVPPRTQFSMLKKPAVMIRYGKMQFNTACVRLFEGVQHVLTLVNPKKRRLAIVTCTEEESASVEWARKKDDVWVPKAITSLEFVENLYKLMEWDRNCKYKVLGRVATSPKGLILVFELVDAIMYTIPEEYVDKKTGEVRKRQIAYYPDEYKDRIGKSYNDYIAGQQMNMFEQFDGYTGHTYQDIPAGPSQAPVPPWTTVNPYRSEGGSE